MHFGDVGTDRAQPVDESPLLRRELDESGENDSARMPVRHGVGGCRKNVGEHGRVNPLQPSEITSISVGPRCEVRRIGPVECVVASMPSAPAFPAAAPRMNQVPCVSGEHRCAARVQQRRAL